MRRSFRSSAGLRARCIDIGVHTSGENPTTRPVNPAGATPTTVKSRPLNVRLLPTMAGSDPSRCSHSACDRTTTGAAVAPRSSSGRKPRPRAGWTPRIEKKFADTSAAWSVSPSPARFQITGGVSPVNAAHVAETCVVVAVILVVGKRQLHVAADAVAARGVVLPDFEQPVWLVHRRRTQEQAIDKGEDGGVRADAERQRQHCDGSETAALCQRANRVAKVLPEGFHDSHRRGDGNICSPRLYFERAHR